MNNSEVDNEEKVDTINNLTDESFTEYKRNFLNHNKILLEKYFSKPELFMIWSETPKIEWFSKEPIFRSKNMRESITKIHYSKVDIKIPIEFKVLMTALLTKDLKTLGIFRLNPDPHKYDEIIEKLMKMYDEKEKEEIIEKFLIENCDVILLTQIFINTFSFFEGQFFPQTYVPILKRIFYEVDNEEEKKICIRAVLYSLSKSQKHLMESVAKFFRIATDENSKRPDPIHSRMSYKSICITHTTNMCLKNPPDKQNLKPDYINSLPPMIEYIFINIRELFTVQEYVEAKIEYITKCE